MQKGWWHEYGSMDGLDVLAFHLGGHQGGGNDLIYADVYFRRSWGFQLRRGHTVERKIMVAADSSNHRMVRFFVRPSPRCGSDD